MRHSSGGDRWARRLRWTAAALFVVGGTLHFVDPGFYRGIVPPGLPRPDVLVAVSGACEIAGGLGLLLSPLRRAAGWGLIALLVAVFPANVYLALVPSAAPGLHLPVWAYWLRLPLQAVLVAWVWLAALRSEPEPGEPASPSTGSVSFDPTSAHPAGRRWPGRLWWAAVVGYAVVLAGAWIVLHFVADYQWWGTLALFAPRWIWVLPLPLLIVAGLFRRRWSIVGALAAVGAAALLVSGVHCPWRMLVAPATGPPRLRVMTLNCDSWALDPAALHRLVVAEDPDILAMQDVESSHLAVILGAGSGEPLGAALVRRAGQLPGFGQPLSDPLGERLPRPGAG